MIGARIPKRYSVVDPLVMLHYTPTSAPIVTWINGSFNLGTSFPYFVVVTPRKRNKVVREHAGLSIL
jgi:hypothetical protein